MLTFTAALTALLNKGSAKPFTVATLYYNSDWPSASDVICIAEKNCTFGSTRYEGIIDKVSPVISSIDPHDCSYSVSNCTLTIPEGALQSPAGVATVSDFLSLSTRNYRNRRIFLCYAADGCAAADLVYYFWGIILDITYDEENKNWIVSCVSSDEKEHKQLPATIISRDEYPNAPEDSIGVPIPLLYGTWDMVGAPYYDFEHNLFHLAPSVCTDIIAGVFTFASHDCVALVNSEIAVWLDGLRTYGFKLVDNKGIIDGTNYRYPTVVTTGPTTATLPMTSDAGTSTSYYGVQLIYLIPPTKGSYCDYGGDTYNLKDRLVTTTVPLVGRYYGRFQGLEDSSLFKAIQFLSGIELEIYCNCTVYSGAGNATLQVYNPMVALGASNPYAPAVTFNTAGMNYQAIGAASNRTDVDGNAIPAGGPLVGLTWEEIGRYDYGIDIDGGDTCTASVIGVLIKNVIVSNMPGLIIKYASYPQRPAWNAPHMPSVDPLLPTLPGMAHPLEYVLPTFKQMGVSRIFAEVYGRPYGAWIDTGGRSNTFDAGDTIGQSAFIIESILRDELGITVGIVTADFDGIDESELYEMAFSLIAPIHSKELIRQIGYFSRTIPFRTSNGNWRVYRIPDTPAAADATIDYRTIKLGNCRMTSLDWIINECLVNYHYDFGAEEYQFSESTNNVTAQGSGASGENRVAKVTLECPYLRKSRNASYKKAADIADFMVRHWQLPHLLVDFEQYDASMWYVQEGDVIAFTNVPDDFTGGIFATGSATDYWSTWATPRTKYFLITTCRREDTRLLYTAFQLHDLEAEVIINDIEDTYIYRNDPDFNGDNALTFRVSSDDTSSFMRRALFKPDLTGISGTIDSAILQVYCYSLAEFTGELQPHPVTRDFSETQATWDNATTLVAWTTPGGDYGAAVDTVPADGTGVWYDFDVKEIIQDMVDGTAYGILLKFKDDTGTVERHALFRPSEYITPTLRPRLTVRFTP